MKEECFNTVCAPWRLAGVPQNTSVLLAFSGGADSRALLHLLAKLAKKDGFPLYVAHVNHGIRGDEADRDQAFCMRVAQEYGVRLFVHTEDVPALAKQIGKGLEETAREVRYRFFAELMERESIGLLVTAHHADDNLETLLFRLCRGSGTRGLCGIARVRRFAVGQLVRPLLSVSRKSILEYCASNRLDFVTDSTNSDTAYTRNRLRAEVVPILADLFEDPQGKATDAALSLGEDEAFLSELTDRLLGECATEEGLLCKSLRNAPMPIRTRALMRWVEEHTGHCPERVHLSALLSLLNRENEQAEVALTGDFVAISELGLLRLVKRVRLGTEFSEMPVQFGKTQAFDGRVFINVQPIDAQTKIHKLSTESYIILKKDSAIINNGLHWREKREGDTLLSGGMHKKLRKLYSKADIPPHRRELLPMLCDDEGIVWAPFAGVRDGVLTQQKIADGADGILIAVKLLSIK